MAVDGFPGFGLDEGELARADTDNGGLVAFVKGEDPFGVGAVPDAVGVGEWGDVAEEGAGVFGEGGEEKVVDGEEEAGFES